MGGAAALALAAAVAAAPLSPAARVNGERAVERARYAFVIGATRPFDEVYPRSVFERKVRRELAEEEVLRRVFSIAVAESSLAAEFDRIERSSRAPEQWRAMKRALGDDRRLVEEVVCRPLLVDRILRTRFAFDPALHAAEHGRAERARAAFLAGQVPPGARRLRLARRPDPEMTTAAMLARARAEAAAPMSVPRAARAAADAPLPVSPEMARVLAAQLRAAGDVTTILEESSRFSVLRLVRAERSAWLVEAVTVPKRGFDEWFAAVRRPADGVASSHANPANRRPRVTPTRR